MLCVLLPRQREFQPFLGKAQLVRQTEQELCTQIGLILEQRIVHLPESVVGGGELGGLGRSLGAGVDLAQREISEDEREASTEMPLHLFNDRIGAAAVRALVVAVFYERNRRRRRIALD